MPPLKNIKHEQFAHQVIKQPTQYKAYENIYHTENKETALVNSSRLLSNANVKERCIELLNQQGLTVEHLNSRLNKWANDDLEPSTSMKAIETGYRLHGLLDKETNIQADNIEVSIVNIT